MFCDVQYSPIHNRWPSRVIAPNSPALLLPSTWTGGRCSPSSSPASIWSSCSSPNCTMPYLRKPTLSCRRPMVLCNLPPADLGSSLTGQCSRLNFRNLSATRFSQSYGQQNRPNYYGIEFHDPRKWNTQRIRIEGAGRSSSVSGKFEQVEYHFQRLFSEAKL